MGAVYRARDTRLDRIVAIKQIEGRFSERFGREAKTIASLNHPHICTLHDVGDDYLVLEYLDGQPLKGPLPLADVLRYSTQIAEALEAAHRKGITHRDLKPANVMITPAGAKVIDFGLAKPHPALNSENGVTLTQPITGEGTILGTVPYMSPEQLQGKEADARSDIFSLGCVMYEMLTGQRAFQGESQVSIMAAILEREPASLAKVAPPWLDRLIRRCLRKNPEDRWQSARDIALELREPHDSAIPVANRTPWLPWAIAACCLMGAIGLWIARPKTPAASVYEFELNPPPGTSFLEANNEMVAISPDGKMLAAVGMPGSGIRQIYLRNLDTSNYQPLRGTEGALAPFWSPDSKWIGFSVGNGIYKVSPFSGAAERIVEGIDVRGIHASASWSVNGIILFRNRGGFYQVPATGGVPTAALVPAVTSGRPRYRRPVFLPDGKQFVFDDNESDTTSQISIASLDGKSVKQLVEGTTSLYAPGKDGDGHLLYYSRGQLVARPFSPSRQMFTGEAVGIVDVVRLGASSYSVSQEGTLVVSKDSGNTVQLSWLDSTGKVLSQIGEPADITTPVLSPDGRRIAFSRLSGNTRRLEVLDLNRGVSARLTASAELEGSPVWSPDGKEILFFHNGSPVRRAADGSGALLPIASAKGFTNCYPYQWIRNGKGFICGTNNFSYVPFGDGRPVLLTNKEFDQGQGQASPDGGWLAYASNETGEREIYIRSMPPALGGPPTEARYRISTAGGIFPRWRGDGGELYFVSGDRTMMAAAIDRVGAELRIASARPLFSARNLRLGRTTFPYDVTPDGKKFLVREAVEGSSNPLTVILNWHGLLSKPR